MIVGAKILYVEKLFVYKKNIYNPQIILKIYDKY